MEAKGVSLPPAAVQIPVPELCQALQQVLLSKADALLQAGFPELQLCACAAADCKFQRRQRNSRSCSAGPSCLYLKQIHSPLPSAIGRQSSKTVDSLPSQPRLIVHRMGYLRAALSNRSEAGLT